MRCLVTHGVQFPGLLREIDGSKLSEQLEGYDLSLCGKMVFLQEAGGSSR